MSVVQPNSDFELLDGGRRLVYHAKSKSRARIVAVILAVCVLIPIGVVSCGLGAIGVGSPHPQSRDDAMTFFLVSALAFALWIGLTIWSGKKVRRSITFSKDSISFGGKTYLLEHVTSIGWRSGGVSAAVGTGSLGQMMAFGAQANQDLSGQVYMQYAADEIAIIRNLPPNDVESTYVKIVGFLDQFGHKYGR